MSLPYSDFTRRGRIPAAAAGRAPAAWRHHLLRGRLRQHDGVQVPPSADALVNVTNDGWFGHSTARHQHFQIVRMRAMEAGRYLVRAANDGISGGGGPAR